MNINLSDFQRALGEWDFAKMAGTYRNGFNRNNMCHVIRLLPAPELADLREALKHAVDKAIDRTENKLKSLGINPDVYPPMVRPLPDWTPDEYLEKPITPQQENPND